MLKHFWVESNEIREDGSIVAPALPERVVTESGVA
jgi:hypothetical protein